MTTYLSKFTFMVLLISSAWARPFYNTTETCDIPLTQNVLPISSKLNDFIDDSALSLRNINLLLGTGPDAGLISDFKVTDNIPGSGPYAPAGIFTDMSLPGHTIYAPRIVPTGTQLPVIVWGEGGCTNSGDTFQLFLQEIASHGFLVIASGAPTIGTEFGSKSAFDTLATFYENGLFTTPYQLTQGIDWVMRGGADKFGEIQKHRIASAGQSCGGLEAYVAAMNDDRIKAVGVFNSGLMFKSTKCLLKKLKVPVGYFLGGPKDLGTRFGTQDYNELPEGLKSVKLVLDTGHMGTYFQRNGGKFAKAAVAYFKLVLKDDRDAKHMFVSGNNNSALVKDGWSIAFKNW